MSKILSRAWAGLAPPKVRGGPPAGGCRTGRVVMASTSVDAGRRCGCTGAPPWSDRRGRSRLGRPLRASASGVVRYQSSARAAARAPTSSAGMSRSAPKGRAVPGWGGPRSATARASGGSPVGAGIRRRSAGRGRRCGSSRSRRTRTTRGCRGGREQRRALLRTRWAPIPASRRLGELGVGDQEVASLLADAATGSDDNCGSARTHCATRTGSDDGAWWPSGADPAMVLAALIRG